MKVRNVHFDCARSEDVLMKVLLKGFKMVVNTLNFVFLVIECLVTIISVEGKLW